MGVVVAGGGWRRDVLDAVMVWTVRLGGVLALSLFFTVVLPDPGRLREPGFVLMYAAYAAVVALRYRPELPYRLRAFGFCALVFVTGAAALFSLGLLPGPTLVCAFVVIAVRLFLGAQAMVLSLALSTFAIVLASLAHAPGAPWPAIAPGGTRFWLRSALAYSMPTAAIAMMVAFVVTQIEQSLQATAAALLRSRTAEAERERTQEALAKTEQALMHSQKLEAVGRLAAGVGHDFNNTLQVVLSWASILRGERDAQTLDEGLAAIESAAQQGRELTQRLLAFGRRDARAPTLASLAKLVGEGARSLRRLLPEDIGIELDLDKSAPDLLIDPDQLAHVLLNLGLNARDAMPSGGTLYLTVACLSASELPEGVEAPGHADELVRVSVRDTGTGMSEETLGHLFEPFYTTKGDRGTGLGLATAYALVQRNAGSIRVESEPGKGSTFHLYFAVQPGESAPRESVVRKRQPIDKGVVMVAEDDRDVRAAMVHLLRTAGYEVLECADATSAMALLDEQGGEVDVLCTDGIMPGGGTGQLIAHYLAQRPSGRVVVCSGHVQEELRRRDLDAGAHTYLSKPFQSTELVERIDRLIASR